MNELIDKSYLEKIEPLLKKWNDACRKALDTINAIARGEYDA